VTIPLFLAVALLARAAWEAFTATK